MQRTKSRTHFTDQDSNPNPLSLVSDEHWSGLPCLMYRRYVRQSQTEMIRFRASWHTKKSTSEALSPASVSSDGMSRTWNRQSSGASNRAQAFGSALSSNSLPTSGLMQRALRSTAKRRVLLNSAFGKSWIRINSILIENLFYSIQITLSVK